jgi:ribosome-dependent ATPase
LVFSVPLKGSLPTLAFATLIYVTATTGYGLVISAFAPTQIAALIGTAIMTFMPAMQASGMFEPVSSLSGMPAAMSWTFPMAYFLPISVGTFTKALGFAELGPNILALAAFIPVLTLATVVLMRRQER